MSKKSKGWNAPRGGKSWSDEDIVGYHRFLKKIVNEDNGRQLLKKWGLPFDCFDMIVGLQFVYAYQHGLALNYGKGLNTFRYSWRPLKLIHKIFDQMGTYNARQVSYEAKHNLENDPTGLMIHRLGDPGHISLLVLAKDVIHELEGPFPAQYATIGSKLFLSDRLPPGGTLRRLYFYKRKGSKISRFRYSKHLKGKTSKDLLTKKDMWKNFYLDKEITSGFNLSTQTKLACDYLKERVQRVNRGVRHCARNYSANTVECKNKQSAKYSTPSYDSKIESIVNKLATQTFIEEVLCEPIDFHEGLDGEKPFWVKVRVVEKSLEINPLLHTIYYKENSHGPMQPLMSRWGLVGGKKWSDMGEIVTDIATTSTVKVDDVMNIFLDESHLEFKMGEDISDKFIYIKAIGVNKSYYKVKKLKQVLEDGWDFPVNIGLVELSILDQNIDEVTKPTLIQVQSNLAH